MTFIMIFLNCKWIFTLTQVKEGDSLGVASFLGAKKSAMHDCSDSTNRRVKSDCIDFLQTLSGYPIPWFFVRQPWTIGGMAKPSPTYAGNKVLKDLGDAIRLHRSARGLSQEALAVDAELDRSYVGGIERGDHNLTLMNLKKIADALDTTMSSLLLKAGL
jgi:DNA-binding XRE family transcriptional regulator